MYMFTLTLKQGFKDYELVASILETRKTGREVKKSHISPIRTGTGPLTQTQHI